MSAEIFAVILTDFVGRASPHGAAALIYRALYWPPLAGSVRTLAIKKIIENTEFTEMPEYTEVVSLFECCLHQIRSEFGVFGFFGVFGVKKIVSGKCLAV